MRHMNARDGFSGRGRGEHRHGGGRHGPDTGMGGRRRRLFDSEELRALILSQIAGKPCHGYEIIRALAERSGGSYTPSPGMVYPLLAMLADEGLIRESEAASARKSFTLTLEGEALQATKITDTALLLGRLDSLASVQERTDAEPVRRAMHNLRSVLMARLGREDTCKETIFEAVALIDGAAQKIERL
jgi:DNA-binding PadR family transcriptional regulator